MKGCTDTFLEYPVVSFSFWNMLVRSAVIHFDRWSKVILDIIHQGLELLITVDLANGESIAVAQA